MIIQFSGGNDGWGDYVKFGTKNKPRAPNCVKVLAGDIAFGDRVVNSGRWKQNAYHLVLAFKGRITEGKAKAVLEDFEHHFMIGFDKNEYHLDAVLHTDTDDDHIHVRIPKMNLLTQTQLRLYFDKKDRPRLELIRDYLDIKYRLESPKDSRRLIREEKDFHINNWRKYHEQKTYNLDKKKGRSEAKNHILDSILELHQQGHICSFENMISWVENQGLKIVKNGYDIPDDFHYITVENSTGKTRIEGDIFSKEFWDFSQYDREHFIASNSSLIDNKQDKKTVLETIKNKLENTNKQRISYVQKTYKKARDIAKKSNHDSFVKSHNHFKIKTTTITTKKGNKHAESYRRALRRIKRIRTRKQENHQKLRRGLESHYLQSLKDVANTRRTVEKILEENAEHVASRNEKATGKLRELFNRVVSQIGKIGKKVEQFILKLNELSKPTLPRHRNRKNQ
jgi:hypothetical protein